MQITTTTLRFHITSVRMAQSKRINVGNGVANREPSSTGIANMEINVLELDLPHDPATPQISLYTHQLVDI